MKQQRFYRLILGPTGAQRVPTRTVFVHMRPLREQDADRSHTLCMTPEDARALSVALLKSAEWAEGNT